MTNIIVLIAVIAAVILAIVVRIRSGGGCGCSSCSKGCSAAKDLPEKDTVYPSSSSLILDITGMHCEKCSGSVSEALNAIEGVSAEVDLKNNSASVTLSKAVSAETLRSAVADKGFEVTLIRIA